MLTESASATLVAIAKNEGPYILEWLAHHLAIGFSKVIVFDDHSTDNMPEILQRASEICPEIAFKACEPTDLYESPQTSAYNAVLKDIQTEWVMFLDIDEFLIPFRDYLLTDFLSRIPEDVSSVHINWRGFGSSGLATADYGFVTEAFTRCAPRAWGNNHHFKSIARSRFIKEVYIHNVDTSAGRRVLSDLENFKTLHNGLSDRIAHDGIQINHYQSKTFSEFKVRMERGDANYHPQHALKERDNSLERFKHLDVNDEEDDVALVFKARFSRVYNEIEARLRKHKSIS